MKPLFNLPIRFSLVSIVLAIFLLSSCESLEDDDPCAEFDVTETVTSKFIIRVHCDLRPEALEYLVKVRAYKVLCDGSTKGEQVFDRQHLNEYGVYDIATVGYNSNNTMTEVVIEAFAIDNNGLQTDIKKKIISHEVMLGYNYGYQGDYEKYIARFEFYYSDFKKIVKP